MPRIRKKTSRRGTTNQREKIKHKVSETRKKRKKESKKDQQWKTNNPKDPGIPNNFPYKDQILAEVAEERRRASEEKQRRKEKKAARGQLTGDDDAEGSGSEAAFDGVRSLNAGTRETAGSQTKAPIAEAAGVEEDIPVLLNRDLPNLKAVLDLADVVIQVLDARDPLRCRSAHIEEASKEKKILLVLNRTDACPREAVSSWATTLRAQRPTVLFRSASAFLPSSLEPSGKGKGRECADDAWGCDSVLACLRRWAQEKEGEAPLVVAVVGVANVGKSSFVNSLLGKAALPTYKLSSSSPDGPTTTIYPQEVSLDVDGKQVRLIDTPGLAWQAVDESPGVRERSRARDILTRSRGRIERLKDPASVREYRRMLHHCGPY
ncbi:predicted protein [Postia placenta Mad-698-R]|nr:predicted protein [Postia placenta Mad-698-R]